MLLYLYKLLNIYKIDIIIKPILLNFDRLRVSMTLVRKSK